MYALLLLYSMYAVFVLLTNQLHFGERVWERAQGSLSPLRGGAVVADAAAALRVDPRIIARDDVVVRMSPLVSPLGRRRGRGFILLAHIKL